MRSAAEERGSEPPSNGGAAPGGQSTWLERAWDGGGGPKGGGSNVCQPGPARLLTFDSKGHGPGRAGHVISSKTIPSIPSIPEFLGDPGFRSFFSLGDSGDCSIFLTVSIGGLVGEPRPRVRLRRFFCVAPPACSALTGGPLARRASGPQSSVANSAGPPGGSAHSEPASQAGRHASERARTH